MFSGISLRERESIGEKIIKEIEVESLVKKNKQYYCNIYLFWVKSEITKNELCKNTLRVVLCC